MDTAANQINGALLALVVSLTLIGVGVAALCIAQNSFKFMSSGGNPRETGAAWGGVKYVGIGLVFLLLATALATGLVATIRSGSGG